MDPYRPRSELGPNVTVGESRILGSGLFATANIHPREPVLFLGGSVRDKPLRFVRDGVDVTAATAIEEERFLVHDEHDPARYGRHSCDPSLWLDDEVTLVARRPIRRGEELTADYALYTVDPDWEMDCLCNSVLCREVVRGDDWQHPELQERYRHHFSPFINRRILGRGDAFGKSDEDVEPNDSAVACPGVLVP